MATQTISMEAGQTLHVTAITQDKAGVLLTTQDPSYGAPVDTFDSAFFNKSIPGGTNIDYQNTGEVGTTTVTLTSTSTDTAKPVIEDVITVDVTGVVPDGLQATLTVS